MVAEARTLSGKRVLVVEDDYFIATDLRRALDGAGATVLGPVGTAAAGRELAQTERIDAALLDVNLDGENSYALADALRLTDIPYMFVTGFDTWSLAPAHRAAPRLAKPFSNAAVVEMLAALCQGRPRSCSSPS